MGGSLQRWQFASQAEKSLSAELDLAQQYGYSGILAKALDGDMWMSNFDPNRDALGSVEQVRQQAQAAHDRGLSFVAWVNPLQANMSGQAAIAIDIASVCDGLAFDSEPYAHFLEAYPPVGLVRGYMEQIRGAVSDDTLLIWQPDPRPQHLLEVRMDEWAPYMTHYAPQDYVSDFYWTPSADLFRGLLADARAVAAQYGMTFWPTLPGNADMAWMPDDAIAQLENFVVWRIGSTPADTLSYLGGIPLVNQPEQPEEPQEPSDADQKIKTRDMFIADIADRVVADRIGGVIATLQDIINEAQRERAQILGPRPEAIAAPSEAALDSAAAPLLKPNDLTGNIGEGANPH